MVAATDSWRSSVSILSLISSQCARHRYQVSSHLVMLRPRWAPKFSPSWLHSASFLHSPPLHSFSSRQRISDRSMQHRALLHAAAMATVARGRSRRRTLSGEAAVESTKLRPFARPPRSTARVTSQWQSTDCVTPHANGRSGSTNTNAATVCWDRGHLHLNFLTAVLSTVVSPAASPGKPL